MSEENVTKTESDEDTAAAKGFIGFCKRYPEFMLFFLGVPAMLLTACAVCAAGVVITILAMRRKKCSN